MRRICISMSIVLAGFAVWSSAPLPAEELPPVKDLPRTIGSASKTRGPLMFCALPDASAIRPGYDAARKTGKHPFVIGWELQAAPPRELAKIVLITSLPRTGILTEPNCKRAQTLPSGGPDAMQLHTPYAAVDKAIDWNTGYTALVMTAKNDALPAVDYGPRLKRHVKLVTQLFESKGMDGYVIYAGEDFEWAYLHWIDKEASVKAFASPEGKTGPADSASFQHARGASVQILPGDLGK